MGTVDVSELRANLPRFLKRVEAEEVITITARGVEVPRLVLPEYSVETARKSLAQLRQTAVVGDVLSPVEDEWNAIW